MTSRFCKQFFSYYWNSLLSLVFKELFILNGCHTYTDRKVLHVPDGLVIFTYYSERLSFISGNALTLKSTLSDIYIATPAIFYLYGMHFHCL